MPMIDETRLIQSAAMCGILINEAVAHQLSRYANLLEQESKKTNLTAIRNPKDIEDKHFIDCLQLANQTEVHGRVLDVGAGAGFPGAIAKIFRPEIELALLEANGKKANFLRFLSSELNLGAEVIQRRAEDAAHDGALREAFDTVTARAVAALPVLCEYCLPFVKTGGVFVAMKGEAEREVEISKNAIEALGGRLCKLVDYTIPGTPRRTMVFIEKSGSTPQKYPRTQSAIIKRPL